MSLEAFVAAAHRSVAEGAYAIDGAGLPPHGSLRDAVQGGIVAELKPRAPSAGQLLEGPARDVLRAYAAGGADAVSVLTQQQHFGGSMELLRQAHTVGLPLLMKDFVVDAAQVHAAAHAGASAVLLIERILTPGRRDALIQEAHAAGIEVLLEVHGMEEWGRACDADADLFGVNARDLDTLRVDVTQQHEVLQGAAGSGRPIVALSGIVDRITRQEAMLAGADGVLVGTMLMRQRDPSLALRALRRPLVKVCGLTHEEDVEAAAEAGADLAGFVCMASTPRSIPVARVSEMTAIARSLGLVPVLVTPEPGLPRVLAAAQEAQPRFVQWHHPPAGGPSDLQRAGIAVLAAVTPGVDEEAAGGCDGVVFDSPGGGTGRSHDWGRARQAVQRHRGFLTLIAGGLDGSSAGDAISATGAWGADASSRLEAAPGRKDADKVRAFVASARA